MDKLKYIKLKNEDGSYTDSIPLAVDSDYVDVNGTTLTNKLNTKTNQSDFNTLVSRVDNLAHLEEGSTTGDAELTDGRIDYKGITYTNIGDAIRAGDKNINTSFNNCFDEKTDIIPDSDLSIFYTYIGKGYVNLNGVYVEDNNFRSYKLIAPGYDYNIWWRVWTKNVQQQAYAQVALFSSSTTFDSSTFIARYRNTDSVEWPSSEETKMSIPGTVSIIFSIYPNTGAETHTNFNKRFLFGQDLENEVETIAKASVKEDIFSGMPVDVSETFEGIIHTYNGYCTTSGISLNNSYKSYELVALKDTNVYFTYYNATYLSLCVFSNETLTNGVRYRKYSSENTIPYENNPLSISAGQHLVISVQEHSYSQFILHMEDYYEQLKNIYYLNDVQIEQAKKATNTKSCYLQYIEGNEDGSIGNNTTEFLKIYTPTKVGYIKFLFTHNQSATVNADIWRMYGVYAVDNQLNNRHNITTSGEWEMALHLPGREDFSGGITHGDEIVTSIKFLIDGEEIDDITEITELTTFENLSVIETSNVYDPSDHETLIATHTSEHIWNKEKLQINQSVLWSYTGGITACYMAMHLPAKAQTDTVYMDTDYTPKVVTEAYGRYSNVKRTVVYGKTSGVYTEFSIGQYPSLGFRDSDKLLITDNSGGQYNKCYYIISADGGGNVTSGDLWKTTTNYVFKQTK